MIAAILVLASCADKNADFTLECNLAGDAVGKSVVRFPISPTTKKIFWSTSSDNAKPVVVKSWTETQIKGQFKLADSYDLAIDLAENTAVLNSVSLYDKSESTSTGACTKVALSDSEQRLFTTGNVGQ
jgi:hypothetical protein